MAIIAETDTTGMAAAAMTGVEHLKSGITPALFLYDLNADLEPRSGGANPRPTMSSLQVAISQSTTAKAA